MNDFANTLKSLRKSKNLTQQELANILDIKRVTLTSYETGRATPDYKRLIDISKLFNISIDYLLGNVYFSNSNGKKIPVLDLSANTQQIVDYIYVEERLDMELFAIRANCENSSLQKDDMIILVENFEFLDGDMVLAIVEGNRYVLRNCYKNNDGFIFVDGDRKPEYVKIKDTILLGKVLEMRRKIKNPSGIKP